MVTCHSQGHPTCPGTQFFWSRLRAASSIVGFISTIGLLTPATARKLPHLTAEKFSIKIIIGNFCPLFLRVVEECADFARHTGRTNKCSPAEAGLLGLE